MGFIKLSYNWGAPHCRGCSKKKFVKPPSNIYWSAFHALPYLRLGCKFVVLLIPSQSRSQYQTQWFQKKMTSKWPMFHGFVFFNDFFFRCKKPPKKIENSRVLYRATSSSSVLETPASCSCAILSISSAKSRSGLELWMRKKRKAAS